MQEEDLMAITQPVQFEDLEHEDADAQRIFWILADVFDEQVESKVE